MMGGWLDWVILWVFSNLGDSMILCVLSQGNAGPIGGVMTNHSSAQLIQATDSSGEHEMQEESHGLHFLLDTYLLARLTSPFQGNL